MITSRMSVTSLSLRLYGTSVKVFDTSARDGIQALKKFVPTDEKIKLVNRLSAAGIQDIEVASVTKLEQMRDGQEVFEGIVKFPDTRYWVLTPNLYGLQKAMSWGCRHIGMIASASEEFSIANTNIGIEEGYSKRQKPLIETALKSGVFVRAYLSCVFGFKSAEDVSEENALASIERFYKFGSGVQVIVCDTTNLGTPERISSFFQKVKKRGMHPNRFGVHFHGEKQQVISNIEAAIDQGVREVDTSLKGLGGCPSAKKQHDKELSNAPTERVVKWLNESGYSTGINLNRLPKFKVK